MTTEASPVRSSSSRQPQEGRIFNRALAVTPAVLARERTFTHTHIHTFSAADRSGQVRSGYLECVAKRDGGSGASAGVAQQQHGLLGQAIAAAQNQRLLLTYTHTYIHTYIRSSKRTANGMDRKGRTSFLHLSASPSTARSVRLTQSDRFSVCREVSLGQVRSGQANQMTAILG